MRRLQVKETLAKVRGMQTANWSKDDRIDWLLFRAQLDGIDFFNRVIDFESSDPQTYVNECSNGIFSLLKKEYDTPRNRALKATARLKQMPFLIEQGKGNLSKPVQLYAKLAIDSARSIDSLFTDSLMTLAKEMSPAERAEWSRRAMRRWCRFTATRIGWRNVCQVWSRSNRWVWTITTTS